MGLTPLEGLMMGTRSGDVDPSLVALLMREEEMTIDDVMTLLNKKSGLKGISEDSLDTRTLMDKYDSNPKAKLATDIFAYRVRKAVGSYLAVLGSVDAVILAAGSQRMVSLYESTYVRDCGVSVSNSITRQTKR
jgi:acetate kinase